MRNAPDNEYQDRSSAGSLASAHLFWLALGMAREENPPWHFTFAFDCPSSLMAHGLADFLRYTTHAGWVRVSEPSSPPRVGAWQVAGTSRCRVQSLASLEHLFMALRRAGARYESELVTLDLSPHGS